MTTPTKTSEDAAKGATASESEVAVAAFHIWEREGRPDGRAEEHWHRARAMLEARETFDEAAPASAPDSASAPARSSAPVASASSPAPKSRATARRQSAGASPRTPRKG